MIIHCNLNKKPTTKGVKFLRVEFLFNCGYWAKWYKAENVKQAKELFKIEYPTGEYFRSKTY